MPIYANHLNHTTHNQGWSLLELMIVLSIAAILWGMACPSYQSHMVRAHRLDGQTALFDLANRMEIYFATHGSYEKSSIGGTGTTSVLASATSPEGWYSLAILEASPEHYRLQASPRGKQAEQDIACQSLELTDRGVQSSSGNLATCWS